MEEEKFREIREEILGLEPKRLVKEKSILFDGRQYSVKIPKKFADKLKIDTEKDVFVFILTPPEEVTTEEVRPRLEAVLMTREEYEEKKAVLQSKGAGNY